MTWVDKGYLMMERAKLLDEIYESGVLPGIESKHYDWFHNRKTALYNIKLVRRAFLTEDALKWYGEIRSIESRFRAGSGKAEILEMRML